MTKEQLGGLVRAVMAAVAGYFVGKGIGDAALWDAIGGAVGLLVTGFWSWKVKT